MNENEFGAKVSHILDSGLADFRVERLSRLHAARTQAMQAYREPVVVLGLVTVSGPSTHVKYNLIQKSLMWLPLLALVAALAGVDMFQEPDADIVDLDAALLTGELPIHAFLDKDFDAWLKGPE